MKWATHERPTTVRVASPERPLPMETTYMWQDAAGGGTRMALRNRGEPSGFSKLGAPMMAGAMHRANRKDPARLRAILEPTPARGGDQRLP